MLLSALYLGGCDGAARATNGVQDRAAGGYDNAEMPIGRGLAREAEDFLSGNTGEDTARNWYGSDWRGMRNAPKEDHRQDGEINRGVRDMGESIDTVTQDLADEANLKLPSFAGFGSKYYYILLFF